MRQPTRRDRYIGSAYVAGPSNVQAFRCVLSLGVSAVFAGLLVS
jgi:hypothetical protein